MPGRWVCYGTTNEAQTRKIKAICSIKQAESQPTQGSMAKYDQLKEADSWERIKKAWKTPSMLLLGQH